jgi:hypothetical protein
MKYGAKVTRLNSLGYQAPLRLPLMPLRIPPLARARTNYLPVKKKRRVWRAGAGKRGVVG